MEKENKKEVYDEKKQPVKDKFALSLILSLFFSFNMFFFGPYDFYLSNIESLLLDQKLLFFALIPLTAAVMIVLFTLCFFTKGRAHIVICSVIFGLGAASYIQGNFLSMDLGKFDGTRVGISVPKVIINILLWLAVVMVPFLLFRFNKAAFKGVLGGVAGAVLVIEIITLSVSNIRIGFFDEEANLYVRAHNANSKILSKDNEYVFSKEKNYIIIIADEYDSFCYDKALEKQPDCVDGFDGFTYFRNTIGMYGMTHQAVPFLFTGNAEDPSSYEGENSLFGELSKNYEMNFYTTRGLIPDDIMEKYSMNYVTVNNNISTVVNVGKVFYKVTFMKYLPEVFRSVFYIYTDDFNNVFSGMQTYYPDNLSFYNSLSSNFTITEAPQFKIIYLYGLHDPRNVTPELTRAKNWSVSGDDEAIAVNRILSKYFELMKKNGVYDNSEIVLMADHGLKSSHGGAYPLLMIKRAGAEHEGIKVSDAPISHIDVYPTLMMIAGKDIGRETVYDIDENSVRERYFSATDEYITENIKQ